MARIPEEEIERLKSEVDLAALVRSKGIELKPHGGKDLAGLSPFTDEKTPSFIVTPEKNLWHCMSSGAGGSVIDFIMKHDGVSFRHAVELLREGRARAYGGAAARRPTVPKLPPPVAFDADDQTLFEQVLAYYRRRLRVTADALDYLGKRGITAEAIEAFGIGFADRTLGQRLPHKNRKEGAAVREGLTRIGLYRQSGHEHFNGCVVFPIRDRDGHVSEVYGRKIVQRQSSGIYHLYLPGPHRGLFNPEAFESPEIILTESVIDALSFWCAGLRNVTCVWGTEGFTEEHLEAFRKHRTAKVYLAYDNDKAGNRAAGRDATRLMSLGIECYRVRFPAGQDANDYALKVKPAEQSLQVLLNGAEWLGKAADGARIDNQGTSSSLAAKLAAKNGPAEAQAAVPASAGAKLAAEAPSAEVPASDGAAPAGPADGPEEATKEKKESPGVTVTETNEAVLITIHERQYRVRGLEKNNTFEVLKVNLRVLAGERYHLDTLDLCRAKDRESFIRAGSEETGLEADLLKRDLGKVLLRLEALQEERLNAPEEPGGSAPAIPAGEREEALALLRDPRLLERVLADFETCGVVGEATNKLTGYLAAVSRKLERPLAVIMQSTSAAGKTALMEAVLAFMPEEERVKYSAMTGQSLYYLGETNLKHKILAIVEEEGAEKASYALKLLQSEGELTIASTGKDPATGRMETQEYHVEGPVMIFLTTTAIDIDEELLNRCLVLAVDEGREQTRAIHRMQREAETFAGLQRKLERDRVLKLHRNAQRLLEPLPVVNPFAPRLTFLSDRTRTRRDHVKYLALIRSIALLRQHQREIKETEGLRHIEATLEDIEAANRLAHEVLGRSLDELPPQTRRLLLQVKAMVAGRCQSESLRQDECLFTRREVREFTSMSNTQLKVHLDRLEDFEYVLPRRGARGMVYQYELLFDGDPESERPQLTGLIDTGKLVYDANFTGSVENFTPPKRGQNGGVAESTQTAEPANQAASGPKSEEKSENGENAQGGEKNRRAS